MVVVSYFESCRLCTMGQSFMSFGWTTCYVSIPMEMQKRVMTFGQGLLLHNELKLKILKNTGADATVRLHHVAGACLCWVLDNRISGRGCIDGIVKHWGMQRRTTLTRQGRTKIHKSKSVVLNWAHSFILWLFFILQKGLFYTSNNVSSQTRCYTEHFLQVIMYD